MMNILANGTNQEGLSRLVVESEAPINAAELVALAPEGNEFFSLRKPDGVYTLTIVWKDTGAPMLVTYLHYPWRSAPVIWCNPNPGFYTVHIPPIPRPRSEWESIKL